MRGTEPDLGRQIVANSGQDAGCRRLPRGPLFPDVPVTEPAPPPPSEAEFSIEEYERLYVILREDEKVRPALVSAVCCWSRIV